MARESILQRILVSLKRILEKGFLSDEDFRQMRDLSIKSIKEIAKSIRAPKMDVAHIVSLTLLYSEASVYLDKHTNRESVIKNIKKYVISIIESTEKEVGDSRYKSRLKEFRKIINSRNVFEKILEISREIEDAMKAKKPIGKNIVSKLEHVFGSSGTILWKMLPLKEIFVVLYVVPYLKTSVSIKNNSLVISIDNQSVFNIVVSVFVGELGSDKYFKIGRYNLKSFHSLDKASEKINLLLTKTSKIKVKMLICIPDLGFGVFCKREYILDFSRIETMPLFAIIADCIDEKKVIKYNMIILDESTNTMCQFFSTKNVDFEYIYELTEELLKKIEKDMDIEECADILTSQLFPKSLKEVLEYRKGHIVLITNDHFIPWEALRIGEHIVAEKFGFIRQFMVSRPFYKAYSEIKKAIFLANTDGSLPNSVSEVLNISKIFSRYGLMAETLIPPRQMSDKNFLFQMLNSFSFPILLHISSHLKFVHDDLQIPFKLSTGEKISISIVSLLNAIRSNSFLFFNMCSSMNLKVFRILMDTILEGKNLLGFIGTRTLINDKVSISFSFSLYRDLLDKKVFVESVLEARKTAMKVSKSRWLSFVAYGNPQWRIR